MKVYLTYELDGFDDSSPGEKVLVLEFDRHRHLENNQTANRSNYI